MHHFGSRNIKHFCLVLLDSRHLQYYYQMRIDVKGKPGSPFFASRCVISRFFKVVFEAGRVVAPLANFFIVP